MPFVPMQFHSFTTYQAPTVPKSWGGADWDFERRQAFRVVDGAVEWADSVRPTETEPKGPKGSAVEALFGPHWVRVKAMWWGMLAPTVQQSPSPCFRKLKARGPGLFDVGQDFLNQLQV